jgi:hypothetical protein
VTGVKPKVIVPAASPPRGAEKSVPEVAIAETAEIWPPIETVAGALANVLSITAKIGAVV